MCNTQQAFVSIISLEILTRYLFIRKEVDPLPRTFPVTSNIFQLGFWHWQSQFAVSRSKMLRALHSLHLAFYS